LIDLRPSSDQQQVIDSVAGYLGREFPLERLQPKEASKRRSERAAWADLAGQGWFGLGAPEEAGGAGFTVVEEVLAHREFGRFLVSPSVLATAVAVHAAHAAGASELVGPILEGERPVAVASVIGSGTVGRAVSGELHLLDSEDGDLLLVWDAEGVAILDRASLADVRRVEALDGSVALERARAVEARALAYVPAEIAAVRQRANLLAAAQLVGMAEAVRDMAVEFAKVRVQFDKPIGSFQAVAHHCADMELRARAARTQANFAAVAMRDGRPDAPFQISSAAIVAADAAIRNATISIRVHGAMGFTAEGGVHHYLKRAHLFERINGRARLHQNELLAQPAPDAAAAASHA
jgi:alkylation response protein AidB-like acyl-CoA dehydrogenase